MVKKAVSWALVGAFTLLWIWVGNRWSYLNTKGNEWSEVYMESPGPLHPCRRRSPGCRDHDRIVVWRDRERVRLNQRAPERPIRARMRPNRRASYRSSSLRSVNSASTSGSDPTAIPDSASSIVTAMAACSAAA